MAWPGFRHRPHRRWPLSCKATHARAKTRACSARTETWIAPQLTPRPSFEMITKGSPETSNPLDQDQESTNSVNDCSAGLVDLTKHHNSSEIHIANCNGTTPDSAIQRPAALHAPSAVDCAMLEENFAALSRHIFSDCCLRRSQPWFAPTPT